PVTVFDVIRSSLSATVTPVTAGSIRIPPPKAGPERFPATLPPLTSTPVIAYRPLPDVCPTSSTRPPTVCWMLLLLDPDPEIVVGAVRSSSPYESAYVCVPSTTVDPGLAFAAATASRRLHIVAAPAPVQFAGFPTVSSAVF